MKERMFTQTTITLGLDSRAYQREVHLARDGMVRISAAKTGPTPDPQIVYLTVGELETLTAAARALEVK